MINRRSTAQTAIMLACLDVMQDLVVKGDPDINWNEIHAHFGTTLLAIGAKGI